jgi:7,8-dihydro-6-hydroxymethylpterin-pyrophosphokinase
MPAGLATLTSSTPNGSPPHNFLVSTLTAAMGNRSKKQTWKKRELDIRKDVIILPNEVQDNDIVIPYATHHFLSCRRLL